MKIGLLMPFTEDTANPANFCRSTEELGFESMWVLEHPILPDNPKTQFPQGGPITPVYSHMGDQFVSAQHGVRRDKKTKARHPMRALWTRGEASFEGKYIKFPAIRSYPRSAQPAGPPVLLSSRDKNALKRVAKWGDGWCPIRISVDEMEQATAELREECQKTGRDYGKLDFTVMGSVSNERAKAQDELGRDAALGVGRFVIALVAGALGSDKYARELERLAKVYI